MPIWFLFFFLFYFKGWQRQSGPFVEKKDTSQKPMHCSICEKTVPPLSQLSKLSHFCCCNLRLFSWWETSVALSQLYQLSQFCCGCNLHPFPLWDTSAAAVSCNLLQSVWPSFPQCLNLADLMPSQLSQLSPLPDATVRIINFGRHICHNCQLWQAQLSQLISLTGSTVTIINFGLHNCHNCQL